MAIFYCIKPKGNGYVVLDKASNGKIIEIPKGRQDTSLLFNSEEKAQEYIEKNLDINKYCTEWVWRQSEEYPY